MPSAVLVPDPGEVAQGLDHQADGGKRAGSLCSQCTAAQSDKENAGGSNAGNGVRYGAQEGGAARLLQRRIDQTFRSLADKTRLRPDAAEEAQFRCMRYAFAHIGGKPRPARPQPLVGGSEPRFGEHQHNKSDSDRHGRGDAKTRIHEERGTDSTRRAWQHDER